MNITSLTPQQLRHAADLQEKIASLQNELARYLGASTTATATTSFTPRKKSRMSAAGRAAIIAAQKARWAKVKSGKPAKAAKAAGTSKPKRKMSAAARAKIAAVARARWAKVKASGKKAL